MDAVVLYTKAIDKYYQDNCQRNTKICPTMHNKFDGETFFSKYIVTKNMETEGKSETFHNLKHFNLLRLSCNWGTLSYQPGLQWRQHSLEN